MGIKVCALVGRSGTGKSYHAMNLCREKMIESIIDDGLFIYRGSVTAGVSAKRQETKIGAVKTALFTEQEHRDQVASRIRELAPESILILGTSIRMIEQIARRLDLPEVSDLTRIEEITTEEERLEARKQRQELGKHVIPAPTFQLKRDFSGYFLDPLRIFRGRSGGRGSDGEKTVVRPTYSYLGDFTISDKVITDIVNCIADRSGGAVEVQRVSTVKRKEGIVIQTAVLGKKGRQIMEDAREFQKQIAAQVEMMTAFNIMAVDIELRGLRR